MKYIEPFVGDPMDPEYLGMLKELSPWWSDLALRGLWHTSVPKVLKEELAIVAASYGITENEALLLNLLYEVGGGGGCISAALRDDKGATKVFRQLEWDLPDFVSSRARLEDDLITQQISGCVGVYDGMRNGVAMCLNLPPSYGDGFNLIGRPACWAVREALQSERPLAFLLDSGPVARSAFVLVSTPESAYHVHLRLSGRHEVLNKGPEILVGNDWSIDEYTEDTLRMWFEEGGSDTGLVLEEAENLPEGIKDRWGVLHSVLYTP